MPKLLSYILVFILCFFFFKNTLAQSTQTIIYTTKDGLASNSVYRALLDKRGFLWIATDLGVSRFDGKIFRTYTTTQGLPDNEIIDLMLDSTGTVWAIPFGKGPSYYNLGKDRFENSDTDAEMKKIDLASSSTANVLQNGGVAFSNNRYDIFIYHKGITSLYASRVKAKIPAPTKIYEVQPGKLLLVSSDSFRYLSNGLLTTGKALHAIKSVWCERVRDTLYIGEKNAVSKMVLDANGNTTLLHKQVYPFDIRILGYTGKKPTITSVNDITYLLNPATLELGEIIASGSNVRNVLQDNYGNSWLCTREAGLIKVQQKRISSFTALPALQQNFNTIARVGNNFITGNNKGEVLAYDGVYGLTKTALSTEVNSDTWVRKVLEIPGGIYVATQTGSYLFNKMGNRILNTFSAMANRSSKAVVKINDSTLAMGTHGSVYKMALPGFRVTDSIYKRVVSLAAGEKGQVYVGSNDGLYRWENGRLDYFGGRRKGLRYKINSLCSTPDGLLFVGPGSDSLFVIKDKMIVAAIALGDIIPGNTCKSLYSNRAGEVWLGTNKGLNRIIYKMNGNDFAWSNTSFGTADGLSGEQVNDIFISKDTVFLATNGGISFLPVSMQLPVADITTFITRVTIDGRDTAVAATYDLPYDKNDVTIEYSAVDLTGYYPTFQYKVNNGNWLKLERNVLELKRLAPGVNNISIRALKRNGLASSQVATVNIFINTPFWKNGLFWLAVVLVLFFSIFFFLQRRNKEKQQAAVEKVVTEKKLSELEMQALKAQINPHFVFNCLNSIKGFLFEEDFKQADKYLDKFSELLRSTLDNSSSSLIALEEEIKYLDNYLQLEKLRFDDKFTYKVLVEEGIDKRSIFVPAMLLQPYVENAIRHGIRHLENKQGLLQISVTASGDGIQCSIDDNGIGREKAVQLRNALHTEYQSRGMQISKRRAELYNIEEAIVDKKDATGHAAGTTILLTIPGDLKP